MTAYFLSDIHLKSPTDEKALRLERFLLRLLRDLKERKEPLHLFLVGDIFDLWVGDHAYFADRYRALVDSIRELVRHGAQVHFFEGNHDLHLKEFWQDEVGARVHTDNAIFDLDGKRVRVEHGDMINPEDKGYRFLRWLLRTPLVRGLAMNLPARVVAAIGERASRASREHTSGDGRKSVSSDRVRAMIHAYAESVYQEEPFDLMISGHVHVKDDYSFEPDPGKTSRSINLGSWFEGAPVFVLASQGYTGFIEAN